MATLGGVTLPSQLFNSERYEITLAQQYRVGVTQTLITNDPTSGAKYGWRLRWRMLTSADRDTLRTRYTTFGDQAFVPDNTTGTPFTVQVMVRTWQQDPVTIAGGGFRYNVGFTVEEV